MNAFVALILAASMLLGGGATVAAAQNDLPNQPLYHLKLWTEDVTLAIHSDPQEQAALLMEMAQTRVEEMAALAEMDISPPDQVRDRLEQHLNRTLILAAEMDDDNREQVLLTLHDRLQTQDRLMERLQTHANKQNEPLLTRTRQMLQANLHLIDQGLADPQGFRYIMQNRMQHDQEEEVNADPNQQGEPGSHQNDGNGQPNGKPGSGSENGNSEDKHSPNGPDPDKPKSGNGAGGSDNEAPEKPKSDDHPKDGNGPGSGSGADSGNGSGEGGKN